MAKLTGIISKLKGSVGSFTFKQDGGQTVASENSPSLQTLKLRVSRAAHEVDERHPVVSIVGCLPKTCFRGHAQRT